MLPYASRAVAKAAPALATGALSALGSLGIDKLFRKKQTGGFLVPQSKIDQLIKYKSMLSKKQKEDIVTALQSGGQLVIKPTPTQSGGFIGTLLASIGIPLLMNALTGRGLHVEKSRPRRSIPVFVPSTSVTNKKGGKGHSMMPYPLQPPPFIGSWDYDKIGLGMNPKKKNYCGKGLLLGKNSPFNNIPILGSIYKPLSNFDLLDWIKRLGIKHFRGVFSRDNLPKQIKNKECGIVNLDTHIGQGTHWVCYRNVDRFCEYFDSFGLSMPLEGEKYMSTSGKQLEYSGDEIQERDSVLCGYWCLYYLLERQKGRSILRTIHNSKFDMSDTSVNHRFIINYFKNM